MGRVGGDMCVLRMCLRAGEGGEVRRIKGEQASHTPQVCVRAAGGADESLRAFQACQGALWPGWRQ